MTLEIKIDLDNDAFYQNFKQEINTILQEISRKLPPDPHVSNPVIVAYDHNGNQTGTARIKP